MGWIVAAGHPQARGDRDYFVAKETVSATSVGYAASPSVVAELGLGVEADRVAGADQVLLTENFPSAKRVLHRPEQPILGARPGVFPGVAP